MNAADRERVEEIRSNLRKQDYYDWLDDLKHLISLIKRQEAELEAFRSGARLCGEPDCGSPGNWFDCGHVVCDLHQAESSCARCDTYENEISNLQAALKEAGVKT